MRFFSNIRLLLLAIWLGGAVFFIGVAQTAFMVLPQRESAGAVVGANLAILNYAGIGVGVLLLLSSVVGSALVSKLWLWVERFLLLVVAAACAVGQFVIATWLAALRSQMGRSIDEVAADDPLRVQFNTLHEYSVWVMMAAMAAALITFFIIANRKFDAAKETKADIYDFSKEFKA